MFRSNRSHDENNGYRNDNIDNIDRHRGDRYPDNDRYDYSRRSGNYQRGRRYYNKSKPDGYNDYRHDDYRRRQDHDDRDRDGTDYRPRGYRRGYQSYNRPQFRHNYDNSDNHKSEDRGTDNGRYTDDRNTDRNTNYGHEQRNTNFREQDKQQTYPHRGHSFKYGYRPRGQYFTPNMNIQRGPAFGIGTYPGFVQPVRAFTGPHKMIQVASSRNASMDDAYFENLRKKREEDAKIAIESLKEAQSKEQNTDLSTVIDKALASSVSNAFSKAKKQYGNREIQRRRSESFSKVFFQAHKNVQLKKKTFIVSTMKSLWSLKSNDVKECKYDIPFPNLFIKDISTSTNYPWVSETRGMFGRKPVRDMKFSKSESMNLLQISDRKQLIRSSVNSILNKLTPDTMNVLSSELVNVLTTNKETKLKKEEELEMVTQLIVKNALLMHKYSPQLAMLCAILFGRINVQNRNFNDTLFESIFNEFITAINIEEATEQSIPETKGIYIFLANLYNAKVMSKEGIVDIIVETTKKSSNPNYCLFLESLIHMAAIISKKNDDVKALKFSLIRDSVNEFINQQDKTDQTDRLKYRMLDLDHLLGGNKEKVIEEDSEKGAEEHNDEGLQEVFVAWYKNETKSTKIEYKRKNMLWDLHIKIFNLFIHLLSEDGEERKQLSTFFNKFGHTLKKSLNTFKISLNKAIIMLLILRTDFELDWPNYFDILTNMLKGINKELIEDCDISSFSESSEKLNSIGYEVNETEQNVKSWLDELLDKLIK